VSDENDRLASIDALKAAAAVAVTMMHAVPDPFAADGAVFDRLAFALTFFNVPIFLLTAGFLSERRRPVEWDVVRGRLQRLLVPYLVATAVTLLLGYWEPTSLRGTVKVILTGAGLGIYYFVPVLAGCFLLLPLLSRLPTGVLAALTTVLALYAQAARSRPTWLLTHEFFWKMRDPLLQFHLGYFLLGVLAARSLSELRRLQARRSGLVLAVSAAGVVAHATIAVVNFPALWQPLPRLLYVLCVIGVVASLAPAGRVSAPIRFLSEATLTIYLYHLLVYPLVMPWADARLASPLRVALVSAAGLGFGILVAAAGRRLLGRSSRLLVGT
jgi:peptidoglycan/LPS O-acetylase OafA/YrhL